MTKIFLASALALAACAAPLAAYILIKERTANFHKIWELALAGHKLARTYLALVGLGFLLAVIGWFFAMSEHRSTKRVAMPTPKPALQWTGFAVH